MTVLAFRGVRHLYGRKVALEDFTLEVGKAQVVALLGPSGSGKTTALRIAAGLETPESGEVFVNGRRVAGPGVFVPPERRDIGLLFQDLALFPHLTVAENVGFGLAGARSGRKGKIAELLELVGLEGLGHLYPHQLSGGQQQRVALARALAPEPGVLLLDEPFSNLDVVMRQQVRREMVSLLNRIGTSVLFVTHDPEEALYVADQVAVMGNGVIQQVAAPEQLYFAPANRFVASFFGDANVIPANVRAGRAETPFGAIEASALPDGPADVVVRTSGLLVSTGTEAHAVIRAARILGATMMVELDPLPSTGLREPLQARMPLGPKPQAGARVSLALDPRLAFAFPKEG